MSSIYPAMESLREQLTVVVASQAQSPRPSEPVWILNGSRVPLRLFSVFVRVHMVWLANTA